jgi:hypothetical protein
MLPHRNPFRAKEKIAEHVAAMSGAGEITRSWVDAGNVNHGFPGGS